jgi:hypothetical protein
MERKQGNPYQYWNHISLTGEKKEISCWGDVAVSSSNLEMLIARVEEEACS